MFEAFKGITEEDYRKLLAAVPAITILIAGADGTIKADEKEWAAKVTKIRSYHLPRRLSTFYKKVGKTFSRDVSELAGEFRNDPEGTMRKLKFQLADLNDVFARLEDHQLAYELYLSFRSFARHVARSTGGFLGWGAISPAEDELIGLTMIHPIPPPVTDAG